MAVQIWSPNRKLSPQAERKYTEAVALCGRHFQEEMERQKLATPLSREEFYRSIAGPAF